jgi:hypothetical protein
MAEASFKRYIATDYSAKAGLWKGEKSSEGKKKRALMISGSLLGALAPFWSVF